MGRVHDEHFFRVEMEKPMPSFMDSWPTDENPDGFYKFASVWIEFSQDLSMIERETYGVLEWLGDIGGLTDALIGIGKVFITPFSAFVLNSKILT